MHAATYFMQQASNLMLRGSFMTSHLSRLATIALAGSLFAMWPFLEGCSHSTHAALKGNAPLLQQDAPLHARGGANPNAPYTLANTTPQLVKRPPAVDPATVDACDDSRLSVTEIAAAVNGRYRGVKLAFHNESDAPCKLGGYPSISLLDESGAPVASVVIDRVTSSTLSAELAQKPLQIAENPSNAEVVLAPKSEAWFQLGWSSGDGCPVISRISVSAPGSSETFTVSHPLTVCDGRVQITTLRSGPDTD